MIVDISNQQLKHTSQNTRKFQMDQANVRRLLLQEDTVSESTSVNFRPQPIQCY